MDSEDKTKTHLTVAQGRRQHAQRCALRPSPRRFPLCVPALAACFPRAFRLFSARSLVAPPLALRISAVLALRVSARAPPPSHAPLARRPLPARAPAAPVRASAATVSFCARYAVCASLRWRLLLSLLHHVSFALFACLCFAFVSRTARGSRALLDWDFHQ
jgi:hypothetical protein